MIKLGVTMAFLEIFDRVADHIRQQGVKVTFKRGKPLIPSAIERSRTESLIPIPESMAEFYPEVGDGLVFSWTANGDGAAFGNNRFPKLADCTVKSLDELKWKIEWTDSYDFRFTDNPMLAKETALKMRKWMPFHTEANGDTFCLDTAIDPAPVVFNQHDWFDGGTGENGHLISNSLVEFYRDWSQVCFQFPKGLWWPGVLKKSEGGVDWNSAEFQKPFRLETGDN